MQVRELILDCLATNPRKRPSAVEIVERLRAMPDPPAGTPGAAGQRARLGGRRRSGGLPAPGPAAEQPGAAEAGGQQQAGAALGQLPAPGQRAPPQRRSSESDSSLRSLEAAGGTAGPATVGPTLPAAYASPVPGSGAALAAQRLMALAGGGGSGSAALAGRRAGSMLPGELPPPAEPLQPPPAALHRLHTASSSPPGGLLGQPLTPVAEGAASQAGAGLRPPRPPRPAASIPMARQQSLDDPATQLAGGLGLHQMHENVHAQCTYMHAGRAAGTAGTAPCAARLSRHQPMLAPTRLAA